MNCVTADAAQRRATAAPAAAAVAVSQQYNAQSDIPAPGTDGRVLYTYGAGQATLVCAPLRMCIIELQQGEKSRALGEVAARLGTYVFGDAEDAKALVKHRNNDPAAANAETFASPSPAPRLSGNAAVAGTAASGLRPSSQWAASAPIATVRLIAAAT